MKVRAHTTHARAHTHTHTRKACRPAMSNTHTCTVTQKGIPSWPDGDRTSRTSRHRSTKALSRANTGLRQVSHILSCVTGLAWLRWSLLVLKMMLAGGVRMGVESGRANSLLNRSDSLLRCSCDFTRRGRPRRFLPFHTRSRVHITKLPRSSRRS